MKCNNQTDGKLLCLKCNTCLYFLESYDAWGDLFNDIISDKEYIIIINKLKEKYESQDNRKFKKVLFCGGGEKTKQDIKVLKKLLDEGLSISSGLQQSGRPESEETYLKELEFIEKEKNVLDNVVRDIAMALTGKEIDFMPETKNCLRDEYLKAFMEPCGHKDSMSGAQLHGVCMVCYKDRGIALCKEFDNITAICDAEHCPPNDKLIQRVSGLFLNIEESRDNTEDKFRELKSSILSALDKNMLDEGCGSWWLDRAKRIVDKV